MTKIESLLQELRESREYFDRSTKPLGEENSSFAPTEEMYTVAQRVAHVARSMQGMLDGAFSPDGFDMEMESYEREIRQVSSLEAARRELEGSYAKAEEMLKSKTEDEWDELLPQGPMFGGQPRWKVIPAIIEHNAHHRGALTVYTRLIGKKPPVPYMDVEPK